MTISLLIPVCDYDIVAIVHSMKSCMGNIPEFLEILIGDDGSTPENKTKYITYRQIESVGLGYIKDVSTAQKTAYNCAVQMADKFGYFDDQDNERFALNQPDEVDEIRGASAGGATGGGMSKDAVMDYLKMMAGMPTHEQPPLKLWISLVEAAQLAMQRYVGQKGYSGLNEGEK